MTMSEPDDFEAGYDLAEDYECDGYTCCSQHTCHVGPWLQCPPHPLPAAGRTVAGVVDRRGTRGGGHP